MAGGLTISTLNDSSGVLATQNGMSGIAKAWVNFNGGTAAIRSSFNVGSITRTGTGNYTVNFTTAMPDANYSVQVNNSPFGNGFGTSNNVFGTGYNTATTPTTSSFTICTYQTANGTAADAGYVTVTVNR